MAAHASRVVIAYSDSFNTYTRVSTDTGVTFGPRHVLWPQPTDGNSAVYPMTVDTRSGVVLVEAKRIRGDDVASGDLDSFAARGFTSTDDGIGWSATSTHTHADQSGALFGPKGAMQVAEAWDRSYVGDLQLRFQSRPL